MKRICAVRVFAYYGHFLLKLKFVAVSLDLSFSFLFLNLHEFLKLLKQSHEVMFEFFIIA